MKEQPEQSDKFNVPNRTDKELIAMMKGKKLEPEKTDVPKDTYEGWNKFHLIEYAIKADKQLADLRAELENIKRDASPYSSRGYVTIDGRDFYSPELVSKIEAERDKLKDDDKDWKFAHSILLAENERLKAENERLKEAIIKTLPDRCINDDPKFCAHYLGDSYGCKQCF